MLLKSLILILCIGGLVLSVPEIFVTAYTYINKNEPVNMIGRTLSISLVEDGLINVKDSYKLKYVEDYSGKIHLKGISTEKAQEYSETRFNTWGGSEYINAVKERDLDITREGNFISFSHNGKAGSIKEYSIEYIMEIKEQDLDDIDYLVMDIGQGFNMEDIGVVECDFKFTSSVQWKREQYQQLQYARNKYKGPQLKLDMSQQVATTNSTALDGQNNSFTYCPSIINKANGGMYLIYNTDQNIYKDNFSIPFYQLHSFWIYSMITAMLLIIFSIHHDLYKLRYEYKYSYDLMKSLKPCEECMMILQGYTPYEMSYLVNGCIDLKLFRNNCPMLELEENSLMESGLHIEQKIEVIKERKDYWESLKEVKDLGSFWRSYYLKDLVKDAVVQRKRIHHPNYYLIVSFVIGILMQYICYEEYETSVITFDFFPKYSVLLGVIGLMGYRLFRNFGVTKQDRKKKEGLLIVSVMVGMYLGIVTLILVVGNLMAEGTVIWTMIMFLYTLRRARKCRIIKVDQADFIKKWHMLEEYEKWDSVIPDIYLKTRYQYRNVWTSPWRYFKLVRGVKWVDKYIFPTKDYSDEEDDAKRMDQLGKKY